MKRVNEPLLASLAAVAAKTSVRSRSGIPKFLVMTVALLMMNVNSWGQGIKVGDTITGVGFCDNPVPFPCDGVGYVSTGDPTELYKVDVDVVPYQRTQIVLDPDTLTFNAIGFNPTDGFIYGWTPDETLIRIDRNGEVCQFQDLQNSPSKFYDAGAFDQSGRMYMKNEGDNGSIWNFPVAYAGGDYTKLLIVEKPNSFSMSPTLKKLADIVVSFFDSTLYGMVNEGMALGELGLADLTQSPASTDTKSVMNLPIQEYQTAWIDGQNRIFLINDSGTMYRINDPTLAMPVADSLSQGPALGTNHDGTSCGFFPAFTKEVDPDSTAYGQIVTYTYKIGVSLPGDFEFEFIDDLRTVDDFVGTMGIDESLTPVPGKFIPGSLSISGGSGTPIFEVGDSVLRFDPITATGPTIVEISVDVFTEFLQMESDRTWYNQAFLDSLETTALAAPFPDSIPSDDPASPFFPYPTALFLYNALPITLSDFQGEAFDCQARLTWKSESEHNVSHYEVTASEDGYQFELIGKVPAVGFSSTEQEYELIDSRLEAMKYYRLRAVDFDGNFEDFDVIAVLPNCDGLELVTVAPNPSKGGQIQVGFRSDVETDITLSILDARGKTVVLQELEAVEGLNNYTFNTTGWAKGMYQVVVTTKYGNSLKPKRFILLGN